MDLSIRIELSQELDPKSVDAGSLRLELAGDPLSCARDVQGRVVWLRPKEPLPAGRQVSLILTRDIQSRAGISLTQAARIAFHTRPPFAISSREPSPGERVHSPRPEIRIGFTAPIDANSITSDSLQLIGAEGAVRGELSVAAETLVFRPIVDLPHRSEAIIAIRESVRSLDGHPLGDDYEYSFEIGSPFFIVEVFPEDRSDEIDPYDSIALEFSESLDSSSLTKEHLDLTDGLGAAVPFELSAHDQRVELRPIPQLEWSREYHVTASGKIPSESGDELDGDFSWSFRTGARDLPRRLFALVKGDSDRSLILSVALDSEGRMLEDPDVTALTVYARRIAVGPTRTVGRRFVFVAGWGPTIQVLEILPDGSLHEIPGSPFQGESRGQYIQNCELSSDGRFLFVMSHGESHQDGYLSTFEISPNGSLRQRLPSRSVEGDGQSLTSSPDSRFLVNGAAGFVEIHEIDSDGDFRHAQHLEGYHGGTMASAFAHGQKHLLTVDYATFIGVLVHDTTTWQQVPGSPFRGWDYRHAYESMDAALTTDDRYLYVVNRSTYDITGFQLRADGILEELPGSPFWLGWPPEYIQRSRTGWLYLGTSLWDLYSLRVGEDGSLTPEQHLELAGFPRIQDLVLLDP
ncbi:MAG: Ig-like domain-containing protein [Planctomycetota bacterium]